MRWCGRPSCLTKARGASTAPPAQSASIPTCAPLHAGGIGPARPTLGHVVPRTWKERASFGASACAASPHARHDDFCTPVRMGRVAAAHVLPTTSKKLHIALYTYVGWWLGCVVRYLLESAEGTSQQVQNNTQGGPSHLGLAEAKWHTLLYAILAQACPV